MIDRFLKPFLGASCASFPGVGHRYEFLHAVADASASQAARFV
jgi:hypothetical protein